MATTKKSTKPAVAKKDKSPEPKTIPPKSSSTADPAPVKITSKLAVPKSASPKTEIAVAKKPLTAPGAPLPKPQASVVTKPLAPQAPAKSTTVPIKPVTKTAIPARSTPTKAPIAAPQAAVKTATRREPVTPPPPPPPPKPVELPANLTVRDLAAHLKVTPIDVIRKLMASGVMANINQPIDFETAALVAGELGFEVLEEKPVVTEPEIATLTSIPKKHEYSDEEAAKLVLRPPVVTVMGHVDHGKTSLLDAIRHADVAGGEAGGITQHIGAYQLVHNQKKITFLDTPGHEAFTAMRARGAKATDIAIIVVAADDGVMPQTREAIDHARAARVPIIIALNKVDKANSNPERVKQQLSEMGLAVYGGKDEVTVVPVSAKQKTGIDELLENVLVVAELADLRANPKKPASGTIIESKLDKQQGPTATFLVNDGTLHISDAVSIGLVWGKIRAMFDEHGQVVKEAGPATPVMVTGLSDTPQAGVTFAVVEDERAARSIAEELLAAKRHVEQKPAQAINLNDLFAQFQAGNVKELNLIIKADAQGSLEPIVSSLERLGDEKIKVKIIHEGIGTVTRSDVMLAVASQGIVIAFNVGVESAAQSLAESEGIDIREYNIIYKLIEDIDKALKGMLDPVFKEELAGRAQVLQIFHTKRTTIAGLRVTQGRVAHGMTARVVRGGAEVFKGPISSLKRFQDDVKEVAEGYECGLALEKYNDMRENDQVEFYQKVRVS
jgi:translation initiation factor IF-2